MKNYFVAGNLKHNGKRYKRGDTIELNDETAAPLFAVNVIQAEAVESIPEPVVTEPETVKEPVVGGDQTATGEPSVDGRQDDALRTEAEDVTPVVTEPETVTDPSAGL